MRHVLNILLNLPHPLEFVWLIWTCFVPGSVAYLLRKNTQGHELARSGELMNFREIRAVGCIGGFLLLTFIFLYCCSLTLRMAGIL